MVQDAIARKWSKLSGRAAPTRRESDERFVAGAIGATLLQRTPGKESNVKLISSLVLFLIAVSGVVAQDAARVRVADKIAPKARPFDLKDVRLLDGPFKDAMLRDQKYLLSIDLDRLLHNFRVTAGLSSSAMSLGGWELPDS